MKKTCIILTVALTALVPAAAIAQTDKSTAWDHYGGGQHGMQYSSLSQITRDNVAKLTSTPSAQHLAAVAQNEGLGGLADGREL